MSPSQHTDNGEGSTRRWDASSRRSSRASTNTDVFSDDYAINDAETSGVITPTNSIQDSENLTLAPRESHTNDHTRTIIPRSALPANMQHFSRPSSIAKRPAPSDPTSLPHRAVSTLTNSDAETLRSGSISSRFSQARPSSPYTGPTAPSQPYAMYPQVTRASSVASQSTIRPHENPFLDPTGPEHPYGMYQNNVPEEEEEAVNDIPVGFARLGTSFQNRSRSTGAETGDIVGTDGHVEQLPPYTRYADNVLAKGDMREIRTPAASMRAPSIRGGAVVSAEDEAADESSTLIGSESAVELARLGSNGDEEAVSRKEGWVARGNKRRCCGLPLWTMILICAIVTLATTAGGVIGGLIGNDKGSDTAHAKASLAAAAGTSTVWLDSNPTATGSGTPPLPTGHYTVPLNNTQNVGQCIPPGSPLDITWGCMPQPDLGISIWDNDPNTPPTINFDDYSLVPRLFTYGPQPPDFNGSAFPLQPVTDKDHTELGVAMFFSHLFDKIIICELAEISLEARANFSIVKEDDLQPPPSGQPSGQKRSIHAADILPHDDGSSYDYTDQYLRVADKPWYCFWNSTVEEFWVYLERDLPQPGASSSSTTATITTAPSTTSTSGSVASTECTGTTYATSNQYNRYSQPTSAPTSGGWKHRKRGASASSAASSAPPEYPATAGTPQFPKLVKMIEKRKPQNNIQPYCQQMQVLNNWQIVPIPLIPTICIEETEFAAPTSSPTSNGKRWEEYVAKRNAQTQTQLESNCICEWLSQLE